MVVVINIRWQYVLSPDGRQLQYPTWASPGRLCSPEHLDRRLERGIFKRGQRSHYKYLVAPTLKEESVGDHGAQGFPNSFHYHRSHTLSPLKEESASDHGAQGFPNSFHYHWSHALSPLKEESAVDHGAQGFPNSFHYHRSHTLSVRISPLWVQAPLGL